MTEEEVPSISLVMGGGGVRAMIYALGALRALSRMGVLGTVTYSASLSVLTLLLISLVLAKPLCALSRTGVLAGVT